MQKRSLSILIISLLLWSPLANAQGADPDPEVDPEVARQGLLDREDANDIAILSGLAGAAGGTYLMRNYWQRFRANRGTFVGEGRFDDMRRDRVSIELQQISTRITEINAEIAAEMDRVRADPTFGAPPENGGGQNVDAEPRNPARIPQLDRLQQLRAELEDLSRAREDLVHERARNRIRRLQTPGLTPTEAGAIAESFDDSIEPPNLESRRIRLLRRIPALREWAESPSYSYGRFIDIEVRNNRIEARSLSAIDRMQMRMANTTVEGLFPDYAREAIARLPHTAVDAYNRSIRSNLNDPEGRWQLHKYFQRNTREYWFFKGLEDSRRSMSDLVEANGSNGLEIVPEAFRQNYRSGFTLFREPIRAALTIHSGSQIETIDTRAVQAEALPEHIRTVVGNRAVVRAVPAYRRLSRLERAAWWAVLGLGAANLYTSASNIRNGNLNEDTGHQDFCSDAYCLNYLQSEGVIKYGATMLSVPGLLELGHSLTVREAAPPVEQPQAGAPAR